MKVGCAPITDLYSGFHENFPTHSKVIKGEFVHTDIRTAWVSLSVQYKESRRCRRELKLLAGPPKPVRSRRREEAKNNPRRRELRYKFP
jgi:hypothetical protein